MFSATRALLLSAAVAGYLSLARSNTLDVVVPFQTVTVENPVTGEAFTQLPFPDIGIAETGPLQSIIRPSVTPSQSPTPSPSPTPSSTTSPSPSMPASVSASPTPTTSPSPSLSSTGSSSSNSDNNSNGSEQSTTSSTTESGESPQSEGSDTSTGTSTEAPTTTTTSMTTTTTTTTAVSSSCPATCRCEAPGELLGDESFDEAELQKFGNGESSIYLAVYWAASFSRSSWDASLVVYDGSQLSLTVEKRADGLHGAAIRTNTNWYGYGCVSSCMKPIGVSGIISSLFTYTGPYDGIGGSSPNQNEIDIEFEGVNTNKVQFNYYTDQASNVAKQRNEHDHTLSFNPAESFNVYGFRWTPWGIEWEVNGDVVYTVDSSASPPPPTVSANTVQKVMANAWVVKESTAPFFGGEFDEASFTSASSQYKWIRYQKLDSDGCCTISSAC